MRLYEVEEEVSKHDYINLGEGNLYHFQSKLDKELQNVFPCALLG
jgi:hypothetical protein